MSFSSLTDNILIPYFEAGIKS